VAGDGSSNQGGSDFAFARYLPDGSLDPSFGAGGVVATHFGATPHGGGSSGILRAVALQPDGKIVAVGPIVPSDPSGGANSFGVARYLGSDSHELSVGKPFSSGFGSVTSLPLGIACDLECDEDAAQFADQSPVTLTANPSAGSAVAWTGACAGSGPVCTVTMAAARSVVAHFYRCTVPRLVGRRLAAAERAIRRGHCSIGHVKRRFSGKVARGRVIWQSWRAGTTRRALARVNLTVSKGRR
jgi:beta-propeller uncharacterized protein DUF5122/PASTA domain-containing protein